MQYFNTAPEHRCVPYCDKSAELTPTPLPYLNHHERAKCSLSNMSAASRTSTCSTYDRVSAVKSAWMEMPLRSNLHVFALLSHNGSYFVQ